MTSPAGADPEVESVIMEYLRGLMQKAQGARAERVMKPVQDPDAASEGTEPTDDEMLELAQAAGLDGEKCAKCGAESGACDC